MSQPFLCLRSGKTAIGFVKHFPHFGDFTHRPSSTGIIFHKASYALLNKHSAGTQWRSCGTSKSATLHQHLQHLPASPIPQHPASPQYRIVLKGYRPSKGLAPRMPLVRHPAVAWLSMLPPSVLQLPAWPQHHLQLQDRHRHRRQAQARPTDSLPTSRACCAIFKLRTKTRSLP